MLDQHRKGLGVELRADLKNYMIAKSQGLVGQGNQKNRYSPSRSHKSGASWTGSDYKSERWEKSQVSMQSHMKSLNDSCYVGPEKNPRVFQDSNPIKNGAYKLALDNYESKVQRQREINEKFMKSHYDSIASQKRDYENKESERKAQIKRNHGDIRDQMEARVSRFNRYICYVFIGGC